jgi:hypothetical protein
VHGDGSDQPLPSDTRADIWITRRTGSVCLRND